MAAIAAGILELMHRMRERSGFEDGCDRSYGLDPTGLVRNMYIPRIADIHLGLAKLHTR
jgi:hypothetical protein